MKYFCGAVVILFTVLPVLTARASSLDPLFQDDAPLYVEITAPFSQLISERPKDRELPGTFTIWGPNAVSTVLDIQVRARGRYRHSNCDFPPLFLNFKRSQLDGTEFEQQNKLKVVAHCKDSLRYQQSVLREYLAYRILNALTDKSFQVRLMQVTYIDSDGRRSRLARSAFLLEHENRLADRLGAQRMNSYPEGVGAIEADHLNLTSIFQYLLGNTDFSPIIGSNDECCHNYAMFTTADGPLLAIPHDFDMSGFVNTPYAMPHDDLGIDNVRQRLYQGFCVNNRYVKDSVSQFLEARDTLYALVADLQVLEPNVRENLAAYMDEFYETIGHSQGVKEEILDKCINE